MLTQPLQRVQLGMALTPAERLQAVTSPATSLVRRIMAEHLPGPSAPSSSSSSSNGGPALLEFDTARGAAFRCVAQAAWNVVRHPGQKSLGSMPALETWLVKSDGLLLPATGAGAAKAAKAKEGEEGVADGRVVRKVERVFEVFREIVSDEGTAKVIRGAGGKGKAGKLAPVEVVVIPVMIVAWGEKLGRAQLARAIAAMRKQVS
jgi:hypothetical protein